MLFTKLAIFMTEKTVKLRKPDHWQRCSAIRCKATQHRAVCPKGKWEDTELDAISSSSAPRSAKVLAPNLPQLQTGQGLKGATANLVKWRSKRGFLGNLSWHGWPGDHKCAQTHQGQTLKQDNGHPPEQRYWHQNSLKYRGWLWGCSSTSTQVPAVWNYLVSLPLCSE